MNILSFISTISFCLAVFQGIYLLSMDHQSLTNRLFACIALCIAVWSFSAAFGYSASTKEEVIFWFKGTTFGFVFLHAFTLHFCARLARVRWIRSPLLFLIYAPSFYFLYRGLAEIFVFSDFVKEGDFWIGLPAFGNTVFYIFAFNYLAYYCASIIILLRWRRKSRSNREKKQALIVAFSIGITIALYNLEPFVLPAFTSYKTLIISPNMGIVWITGLWIAITRYRLLSFTPEYVTREIFEQTDQSIILLDPSLRIVSINRTTGTLLGIMRGTDTVGKPFDNFIVKGQNFHRRIDLLEKGRKCALTAALILEGRDGSKILMHYHLSKLMDRFSDAMGFLLIGREAHSLERVKEEFSLSHREMEILRHIISGYTGKEIAEFTGITLRTVKAHVANMYHKLGIENRSQLMRLLRRFDIAE